MTTALDPALAQLRDIAPFDRVPAHVLRAMGPHIDRLHVRAGTVLAREGRAARELVAVLDGELIASCEGRSVGTGSAGTLVGGDQLVDGRPHGRTWTAITDLDVVVVNGPAYRWAVRTVPAAAA